MILPLFCGAAPAQTQFRLFPAGNGPALVPYTATPFLAGTLFEVTQSGCWFNGWYWWVPAGGDTGSQKMALWSVTGGGAGTLITSATSGTLTAGTWNWVPLTNPVQLAVGSCYNACTGWQPASGFPSASNQFGSGNPYSAGITSGPLSAYSDTSGTLASPYGMHQGVFGTTGTDPTVNMPAGGSSSSFFGMDVLISTQAPSGYSGSYRLWPNKWDASQFTSGDAEVNYTIGTEVHLSRQCTLNNAWYYSPSGATVLATRADVWSVSSQTSVASITSPSWSGSAGTGWLKAAFSGGTTLGPGKYIVSVYSSLGTTGIWGAKDTGLNYFLTGPAANGITWGPISAPNQPSASSGWVYNAADSGATPPYSSGVAANAQPPFGQLPGGAVDFPQLYAPVNTNQTQCYFVDLEVT